MFVYWSVESETAIAVPLTVEIQDWSVCMLAGFRSSVAKHFCIKQAVLGSITMVTKYFKFCCIKKPVKERKYI